MERSGFNNCTFDTCTELVKTCLTTEFSIQIKPFLTKNSDPDRPHGIFKVIDQCYQQAYPLFAKGMAALTKKITQSEDINSFYAKYVAMLEEAEMCQRKSSTECS